VPLAGVAGIEGLGEIARSRRRGHADRRVVQIAEPVGPDSLAATMRPSDHQPDFDRAARDLDVE
jgi:hypothetical protein